MSIRSLFASVMLLLLVAACAPAPETPRTSVEQLRQNVSFYPRETGAQWSFLPNNALIDESRVYQRIEGPRIVDGVPLITWLLQGRGFEERNDRSYSERGVQLHMRTKPGTEMVFNPPILEYPPAGQLGKGASWNGSTTVDVFFPAARKENQRSRLELDYEYSVVDQRRVTVAAGSFDVYVLNLVTRTFGEDGELKEQLTQEIWFSPYVGEVRTDSGYYLVELNFTPTYPQ
jgi:hypothetical protein